MGRFRKRRRDLESTESTMKKVKNPVFDYKQSSKDLRKKYVSSIEEGVDKYVAANNPWVDETD